jgi:hypothetical protein
MRNLLLNLIILIALTGGTLILARIAAQVAEIMVTWESFSTWYYSMMVTVLLPATFAVALGLFFRPGGMEIRWPWFTRSHMLIALVDVRSSWRDFSPRVSVSSWRLTRSRRRDSGHLYLHMSCCGVVLAIVYPSKEKGSFTRFGVSRDKAKWQTAFLASAVLAGAAGAAFMMGIGKAISALPGEHRFWAAATLGPLAVIIVFFLMVSVHIGLMGRKFSENDRELWSVYGARLLARAVMWAGVFFDDRALRPRLAQLDERMGGCHGRLRVDCERAVRGTPRQKPKNRNGGVQALDGGFDAACAIGVRARFVTRAVLWTA